MKLRFFKYLLSFSFLVALMDMGSNAQAQQEPLFTQYVNTPLPLNAAYAGNRNSLAFDLSVRQQWVGIEGAPRTYLLSTHSPINKTRVSLGGYLQSDEAGPVASRQIIGAYSYLVRLSNRVFLSLGANGGLYHYSIGLTNVEVNNSSDPYFSSNVNNAFKPAFGVGAVLFSPDFHVAFSSPQLMKSKVRSSSLDEDIFVSDQNYYLNAGYLYSLNKYQSFKFSALGRLNASGPKVFDLNVMMNYNKYISFGASYRIQQAVAGLVNLQVGRNWGICYSYDYYTNRSVYFNSGAHEITLSYDSFAFYKRNKYRIFKRKQNDEEALRSIRYF